MKREEIEELLQEVCRELRAQSKTIREVHVAGRLDPDQAFRVFHWFHPGEPEKILRLGDEFTEIETIRVAEQIHLKGIVPEN